MRILILGAAGRYRTEASIARAARSLGHTSRVVDVVWWHRRVRGLAEAVVRRFYERFEPDLVIVTRHAALLAEPLLRRIAGRSRAVLWYFDAKPRDEALALGRLVGTVCVTAPGHIEPFRKAGIPDVRVLPQGVDPVIDRPASSAPSRYHCDISFIGSGQYPHRWEVLKALSGVCNLQIRGPGWKAAPAELPVVGGRIRGNRFAQAVRGAAISFGANALAEQQQNRGSTSNRMWKVLGCEGFYLGPYNAGIETLVQHERHCVWYRSTSDAIDLVRYYLGRDRERQRMSAAGRAHALAHHTYAHRLEYLVDGRDFPLS